MTYITYKNKKHKAKDGEIDLGLKKIRNLNEIINLENQFFLQKLNLRFNRIFKISNLENLKSLRELNLSGNEILQIEGLENLINLKVLDISGNLIREIKGLSTLKNLEELKLGGNNISEIKGLIGLKNLRKLSLYNNSITDIKGLQDLKSLESLDISKNQIPETLINRLGGIDPLGFGHVKKPQLFVKYCQEKESRHIEKEKSEVENDLIKSEDFALFSFDGHKQRVNKVKITPDGIKILSCSFDQTVKIWDTSNGQLINTFEGHKEILSTLNVSPDGKYIMSGDAIGLIKVWDIESGKAIKSLKNFDKYIGSINFSADGKYVAASSGDNIINIYSFPKLKCLHTLSGHIDGINSTAISHDNKYLISGSLDNSIRIWDFLTGSLIKAFKAHDNSILSVVFSPDEKYIISASSDKTIKVWEFNTTKLVKTLEGHEAGVTSLAILNAENYLVSGSLDTTIKIWNYLDGVVLISFKAHDHYIYSLDVSKDGSILVSGSNDDTIKVWDLRKIKVEFIKKKPETSKIEFEKAELSEKFKSSQITILRGGNWKIEGNRSVFVYKAKVNNNSEYLISNIQVLITSFPSSLEILKEFHKISSLKPGSFESPSFNFKANESCVGDSIEGIVTFSNPLGKQESINIEPFKIKYVCNLLVPKPINQQDFVHKTENMKGEELIFSCDSEPKALESHLKSILQNNNFYLLDPLQELQNDNYRRIDAYAQGLYDKKDVGLSLLMQEQEKGTKLIIKGMSEIADKIVDILRDISSKCDDIKSDTELIIEYSSQIEELFTKLGKLDDIEEYLKQKLASNWEKIKDIWKKYKTKEIDLKTFLKEGLKIIGKKFIKLILEIYT